MPNGTGNSRNFQISGKKDNLWRLSKIFEMSFQKRSVPFDSVPEFPEILVQIGSRPIYIRADYNDASSGFGLWAKALRGQKVLADSVLNCPLSVLGAALQRWSRPF